MGCIRRTSVCVAALCISLLGEMRIRHWAMLTGVLCGAGTASGQVHYNQDATIDFVSSGIWVGFEGSSPTVQIVEGAVIGNLGGGGNSENSVAWNGSTILMSGGYSSGVFDARDSSNITISGGHAGGLRAMDSGTANLSGGSVGGLGASGSGTVNMTGGTVLSRVSVRESGTLNVNGGTFPQNMTSPDLSVLDQGTANLLAGSLPRDVLGFADSRITLDGFDVGRDVIVRDRTTLTIAEGRIGRDLSAFDGIDVDVSGTPIGRNVFARNGHFTLQGVTVGGVAQTFAGRIDMTGGSATSLSASGGGSGVSLTGGSITGALSATGTSTAAASATLTGGSVGSVSFPPAASWPCSEPKETKS